MRVQMFFFPVCTYVVWLLMSASVDGVCFCMVDVIKEIQFNRKFARIVDERVVCLASQLLWAVLYWRIDQSTYICLNIQSVPRSKHTPSQLYKPVS
jgi:hypothetical protein